MGKVARARGWPLPCSAHVKISGARPPLPKYAFMMCVGATVPIPFMCALALLVARSGLLLRRCTMLIKSQHYMIYCNRFLKPILGSSFLV
jgi:hypothetical protein